MGIPTEILKFFHVEKGLPEGSPRTVLECVEAFAGKERIDAGELFKILQKFKSLGLLIELHGLIPEEHKSKPMPGELMQSLACFAYDESAASYGTYDFLCYGFPEVIKKLKSSVFPVIVEKLDGQPDIGTSFLFGTETTIITARHVVENNNSFKILNESGQPIIPKRVLFPINNALDVAIIITEPGITADLTPLRPDVGVVLDEILTIGYPPIPGFHSIQIFDTATINSQLRFSKGSLLAKEHSYLDMNEYFLMNARVKGGNSGGPVINTMGKVIGIVTDIPIDSADKEKLDHLGYGVVTPISEILKLIKNREALVEKEIHSVDHGGFHLR